MPGAEPTARHAARALPVEPREIEVPEFCIDVSGEQVKADPVGGFNWIAADFRQRGFDMVAGELEPAGPLPSCR